MAEIELKPCPFCGGKAHQDNGKGRVMCHGDCNAYGPEGMFELARERWNTRVRATGDTDVEPVIKLLKRLTDEAMSDGFEDYGLAMNDAATALQAKEDELRELKNGKQAILPHTVEHARNLYIIAVACLNDFGEDPEAALIERCAKVAETGCLVPPDGGAPAEEEVQLCDNIAAAIRSLTKETDNAGT